MRAKLLNYIGEVFECKAGDAHFIILKNLSQTDGVDLVNPEARLAPLVWSVSLVC